MKLSSLLLLTVLTLNLSACTITAQYRCREWQNEGKIQSTLGSCTQCVEQFGSGSVEMIQGCAVGLDAANLLQGARPTSPRL